VAVILPVPTDLASLIPPAWQDIVDSKSLEQVAKNIGTDFLPSSELIFKSLECAPDEVRVVILGQDPYPNSQHAMGLAFSVPSDVEPLPASLKNIFKELKSDLAIVRSNGDLSDWSDQGVLLLNMSLTVLPNESGSHSKVGWQKITEKIIKDIAKRGALAVLWGREAQLMSEHFAPEDLFTAPHPSPLSVYRGFYESKPFSKVNKRLAEKGLTPIKW
jgi:uracil-DNA glycosylase